VSALLEHKSATEERLAAGSGMDNAKIREEVEDEDGNESDASSTGPRILQETVLEFGFEPSLPTLKARELALDWDKDVFGTTAEEDITGVSIWSASLLLSRWVIDHANEFAGKQVCELGAGCGVSGLASFMYTTASRVVLSDLFPHTIQNLEFNVALNKKTLAALEPKENKPTENEESGCDQCGIMQRFSAENPEGKLLKCGGCKAVQYCSRPCQKKAWKDHKLDCKRIRKEQEQAAAKKNRALDVAAIDWAKPETWPKANDGTTTFDILLGSDLVYHRDIVPVLVDAVDGLLSADAGAKFIHVASQARDSLAEFKEALEARGFLCAIQIVPDSYKTNPLVGSDAVVELFDLHFNEMSDIYCLYTFTRKV
jgi:predicted nicotinamide N-methyase